MTCIRIPNGVICMADQIIEHKYHGHVYRWEMHRYHGPIPIKKDGSDLRRIPRGFWDAFEDWKKGQKK